MKVVRCVDEDVVHIDSDVTFVDQFSENEVHHGLEGGWSVRETKEHDHRFEKAAVCLKGGFPLVSVTNAYVVVPPSNI